MENTEANITGIYYSDIKNNNYELWGELENGTELKLKREKENQYDSNAIAVLFKNTKIGYIEKAIAEKYAPIIDSGTKINCTVISRFGHPTDKPVLRVLLREISIEEQEKN